MSEDVLEQADRRLEEALERTGAHAPRELYRSHLRSLKSRDPEAYEEGVRFYREELVPSVASGEADPLEAWHAYGRRLAQLTAPGRAVEIDAGGRAASFRPPASPERMVLHLPDDTKERAVPIAVPADPSPAQRATYDVLVRRKQKLGG